MRFAVLAVVACLAVAGTTSYARAGLPANAFDTSPCIFIPLTITLIIIALAITAFYTLKPKPELPPRSIPKPNSENAHDDA